MAVARPFEVNETAPDPGYRRYLFPMSFGLLVLAFFAAPWSLAHKAHVALHGLCAQVPSHTLRIGDQPLPFDARMTGIYGGFLVSGLYLCALGRYRAARIPSISSIVLLTLFVGVMAVDGTNSLLRDMKMWHPYTPDNRLRLVTGLLTGIALAAVVAFLLASTLWRRPERGQAVVNGSREVALMVILQAPLAAVCLYGQTEFFAPIVIFLLLSAVSVLTAILIVTVVLIRRTDCTFRGLSDLQSTAFLALVLALGVMFIFSAGRFALEHFLGTPALT